MKNINSSTCNLPVFETLEPRVLLSGSPAPEVSDCGGCIEVETINNDSKEAQIVNEIVVLDSNVKDYEEIISSVDLNAEIYILDSKKSGIDQISDILEGRTDLKSLHIISHGNADDFSLGTDIVRSDSIETYQNSLKEWANSFSENGDILLYGCDVGQNLELLNQISSLTQTDVAASDDLTGHSSLGGDWDLEVSTGTIEDSQVLNKVSLETYNNVLVNETFDFNSLPSLPSQPTSYTITENSQDLNITSVGGGLSAYALDEGGTALNGAESLSTDGLGLGSSSLTFQVNSGDSFDVTSITIDNTFGGQFLDIASNKGAIVTNHNVGTGGSPTTVALSGVNAEGITSLTITKNGGGSFYIVVDDIVISDITAPNSAPSLGGTPADDTATEDIATAIDLSAYNILDADEDNPITLTLAVDRGTIASTDGNVTTAGVTIETSGTASMTLQGSVADLNTYLNDTSKITYTTASNDTTTALLTVTPNDGTENGTADTVNITITAVNDAPTVNAANYSLGSANEETASTGVQVSTILADGGIGYNDADSGASSGIAITAITGTGTWEFSTDNSTWTSFGAVAGHSALLLSSSTYVRFTGGTEYSGTPNFTFKAWDQTTGTASTNGSAQNGDTTTSGGTSAFSSNNATASLTVNAVNDSPVFTGLDGTPTFIEGGTAQVFDSNVIISDAELDALNGGAGNYSGATLTIVRNGGANTNDIFGNTGTLSALTQGAALTVGGSNIGTVTTNSSGTLLLTFSDTTVTPTTALVNSVLQQITYSNSNNDPSSSVQLNWTFSDGNSGNAQGTGDNPGTTTGGSTTVTVTNVNDAPTLTATGANPTHSEGGGAVDLYNTVSASTVEAADRFTSLTLTVTNVSDGASEILSFDGSDVALTNGNSVTTATNSLNVYVSVSESKATVSFTGASLTSGGMQTLVDALTYTNSSDTPTTAGNRVVTITSIADNGGTDNSGADTATPNLVSTVTVSAVNDTPTLSDFGPDAGNVGYVAGSTTFVAFDSGTGANLVDAELDALNAAAGNYNGATITLVRNGGADITDRFGIAGGTTALDDGSTITVTATNIGTVTAGSAVSGTITITLNSNATSALVDTFFQSIGYINTNGAATGTVTIDVTFNDGNSDSQGSGGAESVTEQVSVTIGNPPVIGNLTGDTTAFTEGGGAILIDQGTNATVTDADSPANLDGGNLSISVTGNANAAQDLLSFSTAGGFIFLSGTTAGSNVSVDLDGGGDGYVVIGTLTNNIAVGNTLQVDLNTSATLAHVQTLIQRATYNNASVAPTTDARTVSFTLTDDTGLTSSAATTTVTVTADNSDPGIATLPASVTVIEETQSNIDLGTTVFSDIDSSSITVTLVASTGTFATPADGSGVGSGVTETLVNATTITLAGAPTDINTYLDTASNIQYTGAANVSGTAAATITVTANDGDGSGDVSLGTVNIDITDVNDEPTLTATGSNPNFVDGVGTGGLFSGSIVNTIEAGQNLTEIIFTVSGLKDGVNEQITIDGTTFNLVDAVAGTTGINTIDYSVSVTADTATVTLDNFTLGSVTTDLIIDGMTYNNALASPTDGIRVVTITSLMDDGGTANSGDDTNSTLAVSSNVTFSTTPPPPPLNVAPTFTATTSTPIFTEGGVSVGLFSSSSVSTSDSNQLFESISFSISGISDSTEALTIDGTSLNLSSSDSGTTAGNSLSYSLTVSGSSATLTLSAASGVNEAVIQSVVDGMTYSNSSDNPTGDRIISVTSIKDDGGISNGGADTTALSISSIVTLENVNDAPVITSPESFTGDEDTSIAITGISVSDPDTTTAAVTFSVTSGTLTLATTTGVIFSSGNNDSKSFTITGLIADINTALAGLNYKGDLNFNGTDTLNLSVSDQGNSGTGGELTDSDSVTINVTPVADGISITVADISVKPGDTVDLNVTVTNEDPNESYTVILTDLPPGASLSAGTKIGLSWRLSSTDLSGLKITFSKYFDGTFVGKASALTIDGDDIESADTTFSMQLTADDDDDFVDPNDDDKNVYDPNDVDNNGVRDNIQQIRYNFTAQVIKVKFIRFQAQKQIVNKIYLSDGALSVIKNLFNIDEISKDNNTNQNLNNGSSSPVNLQTFDISELSDIEKAFVKDLLQLEDNSENDEKKDEAEEEEEEETLNESTYFIEEAALREVALTMDDKINFTQKDLDTRVSLEETLLGDFDCFRV